MERFIEQYRARLATRGVRRVARPDHRRMLALTVAFTPMTAVAALPVTFLAVVTANLVANITTAWVGAVLLAVAGVYLGYRTAQWAGAEYDDVPPERGWRHWLPWVATVVVVAECVAEIASGGRARGDPVIVLWFLAMLWVFAFLPLSVGPWRLTRRALWAVGPLVTFVTIVFVLTKGFFWWRFGHAIPELDAVARQVASGEPVPTGTHTGGFVVHHVTRGHIRLNPGCDVGFWITGWHANDTRYIVHCVGHPTRGDFTHLAGDWWQLHGTRPPSDV